MRPTLLLALLLGGVPAAAQSGPDPGSCTLGVAQVELNINNVAAQVFNTGSLFYGNGTTNAYFVPRTSGRSPVFASGLWVGGKINGELHVAGGTFVPPNGLDFTFWPGPLGPDGRPVNPADCSAYDRIYAVSRADIAAYESTGTATADLAQWPVELGAPVVDGDGVPGNYNLAGGDRPDIIGSEAVFWVMNDVGNIHPAQNTPPLGIEVRVLAFAFATADALNDATFYRYTIVNKGGANIIDTYVSIFVDPDLGDSNDDYVGSDPASGLGYVYNADNADGSGSGTTYGTAPPAVGYDFFQGPIVPDGDDQGADPDTLGASSVMYFRNVGSANGSSDPDNGLQMYNFQQGLWGDGSLLRAFSDGYQQTQGEITKFAFPGDPVTNQAWSERNPGAGLLATAPSDRRFLISTGPFTLDNGASQEIVFGIVYARGTSNLNSITALRAADALAQATFDAGFVVASEGTPAEPAALGAAPNPFTTEARVAVGAAPGADVRAVLYDVLGREVLVVHDGPLSGELRVPGAGLTPGVYLLRVRTPDAETTVRLVRQ